MPIRRHSPETVVRMRGEILTWYHASKRNLPWRQSRDPYAIWVSEIMLQQTRVAVVIERYTAFLLRFPSIQSLADADEQDILALWSGLGYYRRARMLHKAAKARKGDCPTSKIATDILASAKATDNSKGRRRACTPNAKLRL